MARRVPKRNNMLVDVLAKELELGQPNIQFMENGKTRLDLIETHIAPPNFGGNGVTPQRHLNVDWHPNKKRLPNGGPKILE